MSFLWRLCKSWRVFDRLEMTFLRKDRERWTGLGESFRVVCKHFTLRRGGGGWWQRVAAVSNQLTVSPLLVRSPPSLPVNELFFHFLWRNPGRILVWVDPILTKNYRGLINGKNCNVPNAVPHGGAPWNSRDAKSGRYDRYVCAILSVAVLIFRIMRW